MKSAIIEAAEELERQAELVRNDFNLIHHDASAWHGSGRHREFRKLSGLAQRLRAEANSHMVPGQMRCAKCGFGLTRTNLYVNSGTTGPGDSKTEPCPNGCGPLWPVTWEQWAKEGWETAESFMKERNEMRDEPSASNESLTTDPRWKDAPEWANWLAMDKDGYWWWYAMRPEISDIGPWWKRADEDKVTAQCEMSPPTPSKVIWTGSLQQRPAPASNEVES